MDRSLTLSRADDGASGKAWFSEDRFGMFIHFGLYALPARHEWVMNREETSPEDYAKYFENFNPDLYDPKEWARHAREAGMKYVVLTAKHHEGFCLWDSQFTDYKATNTLYGKDLLKPYVEAFRAEGLKVGFYYSLIDWHHPEFPIDGIHALRNHPDALEMSREYRHIYRKPYRPSPSTKASTTATASPTSSRLCQRAGMSKLRLVAMWNWQPMATSLSLQCKTLPPWIDRCPLSARASLASWSAVTKPQPSSTNRSQQPVAV
jgi:hypothetical protein